MDIHEFFECIDEKKIREFVSNKQEENLTLDFKTINRADLSHRDDKQNFAKAISGFANSIGGIIVWGVEARKNDQGIDCACGFKEITSLSLFLSKLNEFTGQFVDRIVEGIEHKKIVTSDDKGFVVTVVPESNAGPHMAKAGEDRYYKRSGGSFYKMEHFDIEDMFGRRKKPKLSLRTDIIQTEKESGPRGTFFECGIVVNIENFGRGIAKYISLALKVNSPYTIGQYGLDSFGRFGINRLGPVGRWQVRFIGNTNIFIHSEAFLEITIIKRKILEGCTQLEDLEIEYEIMAEEMKAVRDKKIIKGTEILSKIFSRNSQDI